MLRPAHLRGRSELLNSAFVAQQFWRFFFGGLSSAAFPQTIVVCLTSRRVLTFARRSNLHIAMCSVVAAGLDQKLLRIENSVTNFDVNMDEFKIRAHAI